MLGLEPSLAKMRPVLSIAISIGSLNGVPVGSIRVVHLVRNVPVDENF